MSAHTPGPWELAGDEHTEWAAFVCDASGKPLCEVYPDNPENAHLIAAAPDLLEACVQAAEALANSYQVVDFPANGKSQQDAALAVVRAAIAKATGAPQ